MATTYSYKSEAEGYWRLLKNTSNEVKLRLITLLSQSMTENADEISEKSSQDRTERFIAKFAGAWHGDESAEKIVEVINEGRTCRKPVSFD